MGPGTQPRPPLPLLAPGLTEGGGAHSRLPRIRPPIRMGVRGVVDVKIIDQTGGKVFRRAEVATFQKATRQDAQPQLDLLEPRPMFRRKMEPMFMRWVTQECPPLLPALQGLGDEGESAPRGHELAHVQAPVRLEASLVRVGPR